MFADSLRATTILYFKVQPKHHTRYGARLMNLARLVVPLYLRRAGYGDYLRYLREAEANQWRSPQEIERLQFRKLERLLRHAAAEVPYYSEVLRGIDLASIRTREDLRQIPILTRAHLQNNLEALLARGVDKDRLIRKASSGSTGSPTTVYLDRERSLRSWAYNTRHNRWAGFEWSCKLASMWGLPTAARVEAEVQTSWLSKQWKTARAWASGEPREVYLSPFQHTPEEMEQFARALLRFKPDVLLGYTNSLIEFAGFLQKRGIRGVRARAIIAGGEVLTQDLRQLLEEVFGGRAFRRYGSRELDILASDCEQGRLHLNDDHLVVEILRHPGESFGRVLATDLHNYAMPLIRYDLEDVASPLEGQCPCGRGLTMLTNIEGRKSEMFKTEDGKLISGLWFTTFMREISELRNYQVHQTGYKAFQIKIVTESTLPKEELLAPAIAQIKSRFGEDTVIDVVRVAEIPKVGTGKFRFLISDLA